MVQTCDQFVRAILGKLALGLSLPGDLFGEVLDHAPVGTGKAAASSLEAVSYSADADGASYLAPGGCEPHADKGMLTCIFADRRKGLQVLLCRHKL